MTEFRRATPSRLRSLALAAPLVALVLGAAGCSSGVQYSAPATAGPQTTSAEPSATATGSSGPTASTSGSADESTSAGPTTRTPSSSAPATCTLDDLAVAVHDQPGGGAAGSRYVLVTFDNTGKATCTLYGFPGVSWVGKGNGTQIGAAATRSDEQPKKVTLEPGDDTAAVLRIVQAGNYGDSCRQTRTDGFRVYPPGSKKAAFARYAGTGCANSDITVLEISPVGNN